MWKFGGAEGNRTPDLYNAIVALSQLSYGPIRAIVPGLLPAFADIPVPLGGDRVTAWRVELVTPLQRVRAVL